MTPFSPILKKQCIKVTLMIQNSPCGKIFIEPVDTQVETDMTDYYQIIKDPQDIQTILKRLRENQYLTYEEWEHDMNLVFENGILYYSKFNRDCEAAMAKVMKTKLFKLINRYIIPVKSLNEWIRTIESLYQNLNEKMSKYPESLANEFNDKTFSNEIIETGQMKKLCSMLNKLSNDSSSQFKLMQLLTLCGVTIDSKKTENKFKLEQLPHDALQTLLIFAIDQLENNKIDTE